jgi:hypothetical protein
LSPKEEEQALLYYHPKKYFNMPNQLQHFMLGSDILQTTCQRRIFHEWQKRHVFNFSLF